MHCSGTGERRWPWFVGVRVKVVELVAGEKSEVKASNTEQVVSCV